MDEAAPSPAMAEPEAVMEPFSPSVSPAAPEPAFAPMALPAVIADPGRPMAVAPQADWVREWEALGGEFADYARRGADAAAQSAIDMLGVKTWSDAVAVNADFARKAFEHWLESVAKISGLGVKLAVQSSKPLLAGFEKV